MQDLLGGQTRELKERLKQAQLAERLGVSAPYVHKLKEKGIITFGPDGKVDAEEAVAAVFDYTNIAAPIKPYVRLRRSPDYSFDYSYMELKILVVICKGLGLPEQYVSDLSLIRAADLRMLATEKMQLLRSGLIWGCLEGVDPYNALLQCWDPPTAKLKFMERFEEITMDIKPTNNIKVTA
jgi:hypothetical protein